MYISQIFSTNKSKQYKLFEGMFKFQSSIYGKQCNITLIYRSPSQSSEDFDKFLSNFEFLLDYIANRNRLVSLIIGDCNARSNNWCSSDKTAYEGKKLESLTSQCGFKTGNY